MKEHLLEFFSEAGTIFHLKFKTDENGDVAMVRLYEFEAENLWEKFSSTEGERLNSFKVIFRHFILDLNYICVEFRKDGNKMRVAVREIVHLPLQSGTFEL